jgi:hypothetical protein
MILAGICLVVLIAVAALMPAQQRAPGKRGDTERIKRYSDRDRYVAGLPFE